MILIQVNYSVGSGKHTKTNKSFVAYLKDYESSVHSKFSAFLLDEFRELTTVIIYEETDSRT